MKKIIVFFSIVLAIFLSINNINVCYADTKDSMKNSGEIEEADINMSEAEVLLKLKTEYVNEDYIIGNHEVNITIDENNIYNIVENFSVYYLRPSRGITLNIPLVRKIYNNENMYATRKAQISNVKLKANQKLETSKSESNYKIKVDSDKSLTGIERYTLSYTYDCGNDPFNATDSFFYNFIEGFNVPVLKTSFSINLPKTFNSSNINLSIPGVEYDVIGTKIYGNYNSVLNPTDQFNIQIDLEEGYFVKREVNDTLKNIYYIPICVTALFIILWIFLGHNFKCRKKKYKSSLPEGLNSLDINYIYNGKTKNNGVSALLLSLLNKGYISLEDSDNGYIINRVKNIDDNEDEFEKMLYDKLFNENTYLKIDTSASSIAKNRLKKLTNSDENNSKNNEYYDAVTEHDIRNHFKQSIDKIKAKENSDNNIEFYKNSNIFMYIGFIISFIEYILITIIPYISIYKFSGLGITKIIFLILPIVSLIVGFLLIKKNIKIKYIKVICFVISFINILLMLSKGFYQPIKETSLILYVIDLIMIIIMLAFSISFKKRTKYGNDLYKNIIYFSNFIQTIDDDKIEKFMQNDPDYFYSILPYAYALDLGNVWVKKFKNIGIYQPYWYIGDFTTKALGKALNSICKSIEK